MDSVIWGLFIARICMMLLLEDVAIDPETGLEMFDPGDRRGTDAAAGRNVIAGNIME